MILKPDEASAASVVAEALLRVQGHGFTGAEAAAILSRAGVCVAIKSGISRELFLRTMGASWDEMVVALREQAASRSAQ